MTQQPRHINYKSDFVLRERFRDKARNLVPLPDVDFELRYWVRSHRIFVASRVGNVYTNCLPDGDALLVIFKDHGLCEGRLKRELHLQLDNDLMPDGIQNSYDLENLSVELWQFASDSDGVIESDLLAAYTRGPAFTYGDFTPEQLADLKKPASDAAERLREFQATAEDNESRRREAEEERAEEFATWEDELDSKADRSELSNVIAEEPMTPDNFPDIGTYTREELKKDLFVDMWNQAWGKYGRYDPINAPDPQHPFMGNKIWMTYQEALEIYQQSHTQGSSDIERIYQGFRLKTMIPLRISSHDIKGTYAFCSSGNLTHISIISTSNIQGINLSTCQFMFSDCPLLEEVDSGSHYFYVDYSSTSVNGIFNNCKKLREIRFYCTKTGFDIHWSPLLSFASVKSFIPPSPLPSTGTIIVHPDVYAKLTDETNTEWHALLALAAEKNINFATT